MTDHYRNALNTYDKTEEKVECSQCHEKKCKSDMNPYYGICDECVKRGGKIG